MTAGFCCVLLVATCLSIAIANDEFDFDKWLDKYGYAAESVNYETWKANMEFVVSHNQRHASFDVTLNKFAHLVRLYIYLHLIQVLSVRSLTLLIKLTARCVRVLGSKGSCQGS